MDKNVKKVIMGIAVGTVTKIGVDYVYPAMKELISTAQDEWNKYHNPTTLEGINRKMERDALEHLFLIHLNKAVSKWNCFHLYIT